MKLKLKNVFAYGILALFLFSFQTGIVFAAAPAENAQPFTGVQNTVATQIVVVQAMPAERIVVSSGSTVNSPQYNCFAAAPVETYGGLFPTAGINLNQTSNCFTIRSVSVSKPSVSLSVSHLLQPHQNVAVIQLPKAYIESHSFNRGMPLQKDMPMVVVVFAAIVLSHFMFSQKVMDRSIRHVYSFKHEFSAIGFVVLRC